MSERDGMDESNDRSVDGAYLGALFVCRTVTEHANGVDYGAVFDTLIVDKPGHQAENVTVVFRMYGRIPVGGWKIRCRVLFPNGDSYSPIEGEVPESEHMGPLQEFFPIDIPTTMPGVYFIDLFVNDKHIGRSPFKVIREVWS